MITANRILFAAFAISILSHSAVAQYPLGASVQIEALLAQQLKRPGTQAISIGMTLHGDSLYFNGGLIDAATKQTPDEHTVYEIGSISKTVTGTLLAQAVLAGQINLDDDIRKYLTGDYPNLVFENEPVRVKHLLNHTSGLPRDLPLKDDDFLHMTPELADKQARFSDRDLLEALHSVALTRRPGVSFSYSNTAARVCGLILESVCKKPFATMLKDFFADHGMQHSWPCASNEFLASKQIAAAGHDRQGNVRPPMLCSMAAGGAIVSTAEDMLIYAKLHLDVENVVSQLAHEPTWGDVRYYASGLNWQMERPENKPYRIWQSGSTGGSTAYLQLYPDDDFAVVLLTNEGDENSETALSELASKIYSICVTKH